MNSKLHHRRLDIYEEDISNEGDVELLTYWRREIMKDLTEINGKISLSEALVKTDPEYELDEMWYHRVRRARDTHKCLLQIVHDRIKELTK
jgi:hypothetical protein